jgi:hypothetical protein
MLGLVCETCLIAGNSPTSPSVSRRRLTARSRQPAWATMNFRSTSYRDGLARPEFEYEIPRADAEAMLGLVCETCLIEKTRHCVPHDGMEWVVDEYGGALAGMVLAGRASPSRRPLTVIQACSSSSRTRTLPPGNSPTSPRDLPDREDPPLRAP